MKLVNRKSKIVLAVLLITALVTTIIYLQQRIPEHSIRGNCPRCGTSVTGRLTDLIGDNVGGLFYSGQCKSCGKNVSAPDTPEAKKDRYNAQWK